ncbi:MULE domain-containing protein [Nephila pilipes]|uniref:MULE domain-containing protein n=1 Tax=Nephila pilipes TaxID=299642 RepID=A0A8X6THV5_NEPPI|nr:MULE domain-containing protein [Nephila pilipes]
MKAEEFLLVIMNNSQRDMLNIYGNDTICFEFTHGMNAYEFDLATVLDDKREGFAESFILSNRLDSKALSHTYAAINENSSISPKVLMTDDAEYFYNAWSTVFSIPDCRTPGIWTEVGGEIYED